MEWPKVMWYLEQKSTIFLDLKALALSVIIFLGQMNLSFKQLDNDRVISISGGYSFYPLGKEVSGCEDPLMLS